MSICGVTSTICGRSNATSLPLPVAVALYSDRPSDGDVPVGIMYAADCSFATWTPQGVGEFGSHGFKPELSAMGVLFTMRLNVSCGWAAPPDAGQFTAAK